MFWRNVQISVRPEKKDSIVDELENEFKVRPEVVNDAGPLVELCYRDVPNPMEFSLRAMALDVSMCNEWYNPPTLPEKTGA